MRTVTGKEEDGRGLTTSLGSTEMVAGGCEGLRNKIVNGQRTRKEE